MGPTMGQQVAPPTTPWQPIPRAELDRALDAACERMDPGQRRFWQVIRVAPGKWAQHPHGDAGGGFWVVALLGRTVIWFNDVEDGFNRSRYDHHGEVAEYWCGQDSLEQVVQALMDECGAGSA